MKEAMCPDDNMLSELFHKQLVTCDTLRNANTTHTV